MVRRALGWLAVLVLVFVGDRVLGACAQEGARHSGLRFSRLYSGRMHPDVLILGNSRAVNALFAPDLSQKLGMSTDSLAYNGVTAEVAHALALDAIERGARPKWTIIEVTAVIGDSDILNALRLYRRYSPRLSTLLQQRYPESSAASKVSWLFSSNTELLLRAGYFARKSDLGWINRYVVSDDLIRATREMQPTTFPIAPAANAQLLALVQALEAHGSRVCLVLGPYLDVYLAKIQNLSQWLNALQATLGPTRPILDLSSSLRDHADFADRIHSNVHGAERAGRLVVDAMRAGRCGPPLQP